MFEDDRLLPRGEVLSHPKFLQLAKKYEKTPAQICTCWSIRASQGNIHDT